MSTGVHAEVAIGDPTVCQVAPRSESGKQTVTGVTRSPDPGTSDRVVEEFTVMTPANRGSENGDNAVHGATEKLFEANQREVFRFTRETPQHCVCERVEGHGCPVRDVTAADGTLYVTFVAPDNETLQTTLADLADHYDEMTVCRLLQSEGSSGTGQSVLVDVGALTDRQREVLATAHEMGYFDHPRSASACEVASELDIVKSTFAEHLAAAQRNLLDELLGDGNGSTQDR